MADEALPVVSQSEKGISSSGGRGAVLGFDPLQKELVTVSSLLMEQPEHRAVRVHALDLPVVIAQLHGAESALPAAGPSLSGRHGPGWPERHGTASAPEGQYRE